MKKLIAILLTVGCLFGICACASGDLSTGDTTNDITDSGTPEPVTEDPSNPQIPPETLTLRYDDRYCFSADITEIRTVSVTSTQVESKSSDSAVLTQIPGNRNAVIASGTGSAEVILSDGETVTVQVEPAPISLLFLFGQSNAEGMIVGNDDATCALARKQSVLCEEGQIYSTYAPHHAGHGCNIGGVSFAEALSVNNAADFVAASLTSDVNGKGVKLEYPLNNLSANGNGKSGMDSAIAYEWNRLTGEKVWVVNASHSGSSISTWQPGDTKTDNDFWQATDVAQTCQNVLAAEIAAGHYRFSRMGYFWLQGCADRTWSAQTYTDSYAAMHSGFVRELTKDLNGDGTAETLSFGGIILVRHPVTSLTPLDLELNGPRTAQVSMGTSSEKKFQTVYLASSLGDLWVGDAMVENWFRTAYPEGKLTFPTRTEYAIPSTVSEVHPDIHYRQPGYNELGINAVDNIISVLNGSNTDSEELTVYRPNGYTPYAEGDTITITAGSEMNFAVLAKHGAVNAKGIRVNAACPGILIGGGTLYADANAGGATGTVNVYYLETLILTLNVRIEYAK